MSSLVLVALGSLAALVIAAVRWARRNLVVVDVAGQSMEPTLRSGDVVLVRRRPGGSMRIGQVVVARRHYDGGIGWDIKRLVARANGGLYLLGDNRGASRDSRSVGWYDPATVLGAVVARIRRTRET